ncbi:hypothetical protein [Flaviaesturariibacter amylovorans]|uniref:Uncharacterized protein n=1 Tax=Flaviaesturariibacter amylovorans TaxID=1084520 RepID=A0ABP8H7K6_9BACT
MSDSETILVAFHEAVRSRFFELVEEFFANAAAINREREELHYRQLCAGYTHTLRLELEQHAQALLHTHRNRADSAHIDRALQGAIAEYVHAFVQRTR